MSFFGLPSSAINDFVRLISAGRWSADKFATSGAYANRPTTPEVGDWYYASDDVNNGRCLYVCTTAGAWRAVTAPNVVVPLDTAVGWAPTVVVGATATINVANQRIELSVPSGVAGPFWFAYEERTTPESGQGLEAGAYEIVARLSQLSGRGTNADFAEALLFGGVTYAGIRVNDDNTAAYQSDLGNGAAIAIANIASGGSGFIKLVVTGSSLTFYAGVGTGDNEPTTWTCLGMIARTTSVPYDLIRFSGERTSDDATNLVVHWRYIRSRVGAPGPSGSTLATGPAPSGTGIVEVAAGVATDPARPLATVLADLLAANDTMIARLAGVVQSRTFTQVRSDLSAPQFTAGTFAARPAVPVVRDFYAATDDVEGGLALYSCETAGAWSTVREREGIAVATYNVVGPQAIVTIPILDESTTYIECEGVAKETAVGRSGYWKLVWAVRRNGGGGPAAINGDLPTLLVGSIDAGGATAINMTMDINANTVRILCTGIAGVNVRFDTHYRYRMVTLA